MQPWKKFRIFIYLFFLPEGITAFSQRIKHKTTKVKEELCMHYVSVPYDICKDMGFLKCANAQKCKA